MSRTLRRACVALAGTTALAGAAAPVAPAQLSVPGTISTLTHASTGAVSTVQHTISPPPAPTPSQVVGPVTSTVTHTLGSVGGSSPASNVLPRPGGGSSGSSNPAPNSSSQPTGSGGGGGGGGSATAASGGGGQQGGGASGSGGSSSTPGGGGTASGGGGKHAAGHGSHRPRAGGPAATVKRASARLAGGRSGGDPALVHDIRTIVRVIPTPVKVLIAALFAIALAFAVRSRITGRRARRLERQRHELLGDLGLLQRALLPEPPADLAALDVSVAYRPADGPAAGGDFYDVFPLDERRTAIVVGDVMGHGREALAVTALMRYSLRAYLNAGFEPRVALKVAGRALAGDPDGELTTVVVAVHDSASSMLTYACAGHEPPIVTGPGSHDPVTFWSAPPLGGFMETGQRQTTISLSPDSRVCLFTDGLVEARVADGLMGRDVVKRLFADVDGAEQLLDRVAETAEHTRDDMAACVVTPRVGAAGDRRIEELEVDGDEMRVDRLETFLAACGLEPVAVKAAVAEARAFISDEDGALVRVTVEDGVASARLLARERGPVSIPPVDEARRYARLVVPALDVS